MPTIMDIEPTVQNKSYAELLREYALADDSRRPVLLIEMAKQVKSPDYVHNYIDLTVETLLNPANKFSIQNRKDLAQRLFEALSQVGATTEIGFVKWYELSLQFNLIRFTGASYLYRGFRNNRFEDGLLDQELNKLFVKSTRNMAIALKDALKLPGSDVMELLALFANLMPPDKFETVHPKIRLAQLYIKSKVQYTRKEFITMLEEMV